MTASQSKFRQIILAHTALAIAYQNILKSVESEPKHVVREYEASSPLSILIDRRRSFVERIDAFFFIPAVFNLVLNPFSWIIALLRLLAIQVAQIRKPKNKAEEKKETIEIKISIRRSVLRYFVRYLVRMHIRSKYERLYQLYLQEIVSQDGYSTPKEDVQELRNVAEDIKKYSDTLPSSKRVLFSTGSFVPFIFGIIGAFGLHTLFLNVLAQHWISVLPISIFVGIAIVAAVVFPMRSAFQVKRMMFINSSSYYHMFDLYFEHAKLLYSKSVYKIEDDLFSLLSSNNKPWEMPIDKIVTVVAGTAFLIFFGFISAAIAWNPSTSADTILRIFSVGFTAATLFSGVLMLIVLPLLEYRWRKEAKLI